MHPPELHFIGTVHSDIHSIKDAPKFHATSDCTGFLKIYPEYQEGLKGIVAGQIIVVLCWLHQANRDALQVYPRGDKSRGLHGVFATRSQVVDLEVDPGHSVRARKMRRARTQSDPAPGRPRAPRIRGDHDIR